MENERQQDFFCTATILPGQLLSGNDYVQIVTARQCLQNKIFIQKGTAQEVYFVYENEKFDVGKFKILSMVKEQNLSDYEESLMYQLKMRDNYNNDDEDIAILWVKVRNNNVDLKSKLPVEIIEKTFNHLEKLKSFKGYNSNKIFEETNTSQRNLKKRQRNLSGEIENREEKTDFINLWIL